MLTEKDKSINKYQDLLQTEREQLKTVSLKFNNDMDKLKETITSLNFNIKEKDMEILELKHKLETSIIRRNSSEKLDLAEVGNDESGVDNSLNELTDDKIEEMFENTSSNVPKIMVTSCSTESTESVKDLKESPNLLKQIKELKTEMF